MDTEQVRGQVAQLFRRGNRRTIRVGLEHELVAADTASGAVVPIDRIRQATRQASYATHLGFEPGGQVELSLPSAANAELAAERLAKDVASLRADCAAVGVRLEASPADPRPAEAVPLQLTSSRYVAMQRHFDAVGPAGRRMMRRTASTQVCLDWWPGAVGLEQWRVLNLVGPFLAAAFARTTGPESRLATWLAVDPGRTAFDDRLLHGDCPVAAYAAFAAAARVFTNADDVGTHLTTLFPPVRPRGGYLEVRFLDVQPVAAVADVAVVLSALLYDDGLRTSTLRRFEGEASRLGGHWRCSALGDAEMWERGNAVVRAGLASGARIAGAA
jgi:gamma-glutamylcysteine synthetase